MRKKAKKILRVSEEDGKILDEMARTMYLRGGVGLAAVQPAAGLDQANGV